MKLMIDIDEAKYNTIMNYPKEWDEWALNAIKNGTPIPDNATNGDVMKIIFPKIGLYDECYDEPYQKGGKE